MKIKRFIKRIKRSRRKTSMFSLVLIILILSLTLGYAYVHTTLEVDGTVNVSSANWNVYWDNVVVGSSNHADVTTAPTISTGKTEVTFSVTFNDPGDNYEFTVDAVNDGTIDAMISNVDGGVYETDGITSKPLPEYLEYEFTYSDGVEIEENHLLASGTTETYKVSVHYKEGFDTSELPTEDEDYVFKFGMNYVQKARTAVARPQIDALYSTGLYIFSSNNIINPVSFLSDEESLDEIWNSKPFRLKTTLGDNVTYWSPFSSYEGDNPKDMCISDNYCYDSKSDCLNQLQTIASDMGATGNGDGTYTYDDLTISCHLQTYHTVKDFYVEFTISEEMANEDERLTAGTYLLKGGSSSYYEANKSILMNAFGSGNCWNSGGLYYCGTVGLFGEVFSSGKVAVGDMNVECSIDDYCATCHDVIG